MAPYIGVFRRFLGALRLLLEAILGGSWGFGGYLGYFRKLFWAENLTNPVIKYSCSDPLVNGGGIFLLDYMLGVFTYAVTFTPMP